MGLQPRRRVEDLRQTRQRKGPLLSTSLPFSFHPQEATSPTQGRQAEEDCETLQDQERREKGDLGR